jgi:hypothetical protein
MTATRHRPTTPAERACTEDQGRPPDDTRAERCGTCHAAWLDYPAGRAAHEVVFGHPPAPDDPPREDHQ